MSTSPSKLRMTPNQVDWRRAEFILTGLAFLGFITLGIKLTTIYGGLPAHPLFIHVPVVLIPLSVLGAFACIARPQWFERYGVLLCLCSIVAMSSIFLAMQAGSALEHALQLNPTPDAADPPALARGSHPGDRLCAVHGVPDPHVLRAPHLRWHADRARHRRQRAWLASRSTSRCGSALVVLALVAAYYVYRVGDLGAKAVWAGRIH